ncbi:hypothetical protein LJC74_02345, partial [Eubacteriales bacterium OttesenSCG-928-A19]|nr:hypothetical protein [Eubacteriales bacterium OttesenSCG-928-A19]
GIVGHDAQPVDPDADYTEHIAGFGAAKPTEPVRHYEEISEDLYGFTGRDGVTRYRVYGRYNGRVPAYYEADEQGALAGDAKPLDPMDDFESYIRGFDAAAPENAPAHYTPVTESIFAIEDRDGEILHRVFGVKDGEEPAYYASDERGVLLDESAGAIDPEDDFENYVAGFIPVDKADAPKYYEATEVPGVWAFLDKDGNSHHRAYGSLNRGEPAFYPSDALGNVERDALPVQPASDLAIMPMPTFTAQTPQAAPIHYSIVPEHEGLYSFTGKDAKVVHRVYGAYPNEAPAYYDATETGEPRVPYSDPIEPDAEYQEHFGAFEPKTPEEIPQRYGPVAENESLFTFENHQKEPVYRVYGELDAGDPAFYPADEQGSITSGAKVDPAEDLQRNIAPIISSTVITPAPSPEETDPVQRMRTGGSDRWSDPNGPQPTQYIASILPAATNGAATSAVISTRITPAPDVTAEPMPTEYIATVNSPETGAASAATAEVIATVMQAPTEEPEPDPTEEVTATAETVQTAEATPVPEETEIVYVEEPTPEPTEPPQEDGGNTRMWIIGGIIVVAVAGVGGITYYATKRKKK